MFERFRSTAESPSQSLNALLLAYIAAGSWYALHLPGTFFKRGSKGKIKGLFCGS